MRQKSLKEFFIDSTQRYANNALIFSDAEEKVIHYADAEFIVNRITAKLCSELKKGEKICIYSPYHLESIFLFWAAMSAGIVFIPFDHNQSLSRLSSVVKDTNPSFVFCNAASFSSVKNALPADFPVVFFDDDKDCPDKEKVFSSWLSENKAASINRAITADDPAVILYTSGTTGNPDGVILSHGALYHSGHLISKTFNFNSNTRLMNLGEIHTMSGLRNSLIAPLFEGASFIHASVEKRNKFSDILHLIEKYNCTILGTAPVLIKQLLQFEKDVDRNRLSSLDKIICTGSRLSKNTIVEFYSCYSIPLINYYGLTETAGICVSFSEKDFLDGEESIGLPVGCQIKIIGSNSEEVENGKIGELLIKSPQLAMGYFNNELKTEEYFKNGWFNTRDLALQRSDGYIELHGRSRDIIKNAYTELIYPEEIEIALEKLDSVLEAGVCGYISAMGDERIAAFVVPAEEITDKELFFKELKSALQNELGSHHIPGKYYIKKSLPRNTLGKLLRRKLETEALDD